MRLLLFVASLLFSGAAFADTSPKYEVRAVWLATIGGIDWPRSSYAPAQKEEMRVMLDRLKDAGINTVRERRDDLRATTRCSCASTSVMSAAWSAMPGW